MDTEERRLWLAEELRRAAAQVEAGEVRCPNGNLEWTAPATESGGPIIPVHLEKCPYCDWIDPEAAAIFDAYVRRRKKRGPSRRAALIRAAEAQQFLASVAKKPRKRKKNARTS